MAEVEEKTCTEPGGCDSCPNPDYCQGLRVGTKITTVEEERDLIPVYVPEEPVDLDVSVTRSSEELAAVTQAMLEDGPEGASLIIMVHRNGRLTMRAENKPMEIAAYLLKLATAIAEEIGADNEWPKPPAPEE